MAEYEPNAPSAPSIPEILTGAEKEVVSLLGEVDALLRNEIILDEGFSNEDLSRARSHISSLSKMVISQAYGRYYNGDYNRLGQDLNQESHSE